MGPWLLAVWCAMLVRPCEAQGVVSDSVWVNARSGVYHCPNSPVYKSTRRGALMPEREARAKGYRPAGGAGCAAASIATRDIAPVIPSVRDSSALPVHIWPARTSSTVRCRVTSVRDGDTIDCAPVGRVRLIGIDAPEESQHPFGAAATAALASFITVGMPVELELDREGHDRYGRTLAYLWVGEVMVNWQMARMGWAVPLRIVPNTKYAGELAEATAAAKHERRGLWAIDGFACVPQQRRRGVC